MGFGLLRAYLLAAHYSSNQRGGEGKASIHVVDLTNSGVVFKK